MLAAIRKLIVKPFGVIVNSDKCQRSWNRPIHESAHHHDERRDPPWQRDTSGSVQAPLSPRKHGTICSWAFAKVQYCAVHFSR